MKLNVQEVRQAIFLYLQSRHELHLVDRDTLLIETDGSARLSEYCGNVGPNMYHCTLLRNHISNTHKNSTHTWTK